MGVMQLFRVDGQVRNDRSRSSSAPEGSLRIFRHRDFALFFTAASISNGGSWMQLVAVQALMYKLTESGSWLGLSTVASLVPAVLLTPYAGVLADRVSRRRILQVTQSVQMSMAFTLWALYRSHVVTPWWIIGIGWYFGDQLNLALPCRKCGDRSSLSHAMQPTRQSFWMANLVGVASHV